MWNCTLQQSLKYLMSNTASLRNYEIRQKLGSGSYGIIYKVYNKTDKSVCVLKQISLSRMSEKARKNAANEAHIMGKLKHPFIVCYYASFVEDNNLNILMEFCDSGDLCLMLKQQNKKYMKEEKIWKYFIQICMGLEHIHRNKILHRDIKTLNIFLNKNQTVKIGDLGVAKMMGAGDFAHTMVGTPFYLSPELCEEKPYNEKSDIWALGCLLYQLCTFRHPFQATNQASLILKIIRGKYEPIPEFYSKQLREMINICLERDYKRRPTAAMILAKPNIKKMIEDFELDKIVEEFYRKMEGQGAQGGVKPEQKPVENKPIINANVVSKMENKQSAEKAKRSVEEAALARQPVKVEQPKPEIKYQPKYEQPKQVQKKPEVVQPENVINRRRQSQPALKAQQKDDKPKVLFGSQNKADFVSALQNKLKSPPKRVQQPQKPQFIKKPPISFQIPWKGQPQPQPPRKTHSESNPVLHEDQGKIVIHNKHALLSEPVPPVQKGNEVVRIKMEKKVEPKVYEVVKQIEKPVGIIKSAGFGVQQQRPETGFDRKKVEDPQPIKKSIEMPSKHSQPQQQPKPAQRNIANSMKNIRKSSQQRPSYILKKPQNQPCQLPHYPPKHKKLQNPDQPKSKPPRHLPHQSKSSSTSASRFTEVTKQQQDLVANLPDRVKKQRHSDEETGEIQKPKTNPNIKFKEIDDEIVMRMYEQMLESGRMGNSKAEQPTEEPEPEQESELQQETQDIEEIIQENPSNIGQEWPANEVQEQQPYEEEEGNNSELYYQVNKYETEQQQPASKLSHEWSYDEQPQLPMLEQSQTPTFQFEQANPYLVEQLEQPQQKTQEQILSTKKQHLQIKLKQNLKREDEINRLMQMKIEECKAVVPKGFEQILVFFRSKINMDREYTEEDQKEVEGFLAKRNLTDQRKFQNIYKIMHFEMELENTRRIIQSICKKLAEIQKQKQKN